MVINFLNIILLQFFYICTFPVLLNFSSNPPPHLYIQVQGICSPVGEITHTCHVSSALMNDTN